MNRSKSVKIIKSSLNYSHKDDPPVPDTSGNSSIFILFDLLSNSCSQLSLQQLLNPSFIFTKKPCLLYLKANKKQTIESLFAAYKFNPLIQSECSEWSFKEKDYVMYFDDCLFIAISDCNINEDIQNPIQMKILVYSEIIIVISFDRAYFIENLFNVELKFQDFPLILDPDEGLLLISGNKNECIDQVRASRKISLEDGSIIEIYLYRILESIISRYETILFALVRECKTCMSHSTDVSYKERVEYLVRVSASEKSLIYFSQLVNPKLRIIQALKAFGKNKIKLKPYIRCLKERIRKMKTLNLSGKNLLKQAKVLYRTYCDDKITSASFDFGNLAKFYSGMTVLFLPPSLLAGLWGTNVKLPGSGQENFNTFAIMLSVIIFYFLVGIAYLRKIKWI